MGVGTARGERSARRALRLVVLALTPAGFVAMHGVAATDGAGLHRSTIHTAAAPHHHAGSAAPAADSHLDTPGTAHATAVSGPARYDGHHVTAGCLLALLGAVTALAIRLLGRGAVGGTPTAPVPAPAGPYRPRPPPRPLFRVLCVYRL
jgi:hypothetical protein